MDILKVHPRNQEFYDDIEGEPYEKFKKSIQEDGILTPLIVSPDMTIISGHQRYKAVKDLCIDLVPVIIREDLDNEEEKLKKLLATNFGRLKNNPVKQGKVYAEYEKLCGVRQGGDRKSNPQIVGLITQEQIAEELGVSTETIRRLKKLQTLSPDLQQLIEDGSVKYTTALNVFSKLSDEEQEKLISEIGQDKIKEMTAKQIQQYILEKEQLEKSFNELSEKYDKEKNKEPEVIEVDNTDYKQIEKLKKELESNKFEKDRIENRLNLMTEKAELYEKDSLEYEKMKNDIEFLTNKKDDLGRQIESITSISGLVVDIDYLIKEKLAPVKYSRALLEAKDDDIVINNLNEIVEIVRQWCDEMSEYLPNKKNYVEVL
ncbi:ParB N-terminal domain-containing protein [Clostridium botulinum]|nr:ParB N-terminal domain-containing protein [Clostridium botulinum]